MLSRKHFGVETPNWGSQNHKKIEAFISDFLNQKINVHSVEERVQIGTGIPTWVISYE